VRAILDAGFVFWGLFLVFALIVVAYLIWMIREEARAAPTASIRSRTSSETQAGGPE
jgi:hypothetical protein